MILSYIYSHLTLVYWSIYGQSRKGVRCDVCMTVMFMSTCVVCWTNWAGDFRRNQFMLIGGYCFLPLYLYVQGDLFFFPPLRPTGYLLIGVSLAEDAELTPLLRLGAGACAGIIAMSATYPMDMVRGRLTVQVLFGDYFFFLLVLLDIYHDMCRLS